MPSFQLSLTPNRRAAARFVAHVRRTVQKALADRPDIKQADIARALDVHRSVINREIRGTKDMTLGRVAELAWALGKVPTFDLEEPVADAGQNVPPVIAGASAWVAQAQSDTSTARINQDSRTLVSAP